MSLGKFLALGCTSLVIGDAVFAGDTMVIPDDATARADFPGGDAYRLYGSVLAKLREEGLVATRKETQAVYFIVCNPEARQLLALPHDLICPELGRDENTDTNRSC